MIRTQIQLTERQLRIIKAQAAKENISISELVRQAIDAHEPSFGIERQRERRRRAIHAVGRFGSGRKDISKHHDQYLSEAFVT